MFKVNYKESRIFTPLLRCLCFFTFEIVLLFLLWTLNMLFVCWKDSEVLSIYFTSSFYSMFLQLVLPKKYQKSTKYQFFINLCESYFEPFKWHELLEEFQQIKQETLSEKQQKQMFIFRRLEKYKIYYIMENGCWTYVMLVIFCGKKQQ